MALSAQIIKLLNDFANSQPALRLPSLPAGTSNPLLGDVMDAALVAAAGSSSAAAAAASAAASAASAVTAAGYASYTPAVTGDWTGADPTTVQQALDRIAAALGPIA